MHVLREAIETNVIVDKERHSLRCYSVKDFVRSLRKRAEVALAKRTNQPPEEFAALSPEAAQQLLHDMQVHQIQFEMQNEELSRMKAELDTSRASFLELYEYAPIGYCTLDDSGLIVQVNLRAASMLGFVRKDLSSRALANFVFADDQNIFTRWQHGVSSTRVSQECELRLAPREGALIWVRLQRLAIREGWDAGGVHLVLHDITEHMRLNKELLNTSAELAYQSEEKNKTAGELAVASLKLAQQSEGIEKRATQLLSDVGKALDGVHTAMCVFDNLDHTILWNKAFLTMFPEHADKIHVGESYAENLRRFYMGRLSDTDLPNIDSYIDAGVTRYREQNRPFTFEHHGSLIAVSTIRLSGDNRVRFWQTQDSVAHPDSLQQELVPTTNVSLGSGDSVLFDQLPDGIISCDQGGLVTKVNKAFLILYDLPDRQAALHQTFESIFRLAWASGTDNDDASAALCKSGIRTLQENVRFSGAPFEIPLPGNRYVRVDARTTEYGETLYTHVDISGQKRREQSIKEKQDQRTKLTEEQRCIAEVLFETKEGSFVTNEDKVILKVNRAFTEITGYSAEDAVGQTPRLLRSGRHDRSFYAAIWESIIRTGSWQGEIWNRKKNGEVYPEMLRINAVSDAAGRVSNYVAVFSDATLGKVADDQRRSLEFSDPLTGLPNRQHLLVLLQQAQLARNQRLRQDALLMVKLNQFENLNVAIGRENSDLLLKIAADRLGHCIRKCDTLGCVAPNAFVILLPDISMIPQQAVSQAESVAGKILIALNQPYRIGNADVPCSASIGITLVDGAQQDTEASLNQAELAMHYAKSAGRNTLRFFDPQMQLDASERFTIQIGLRAALLNDQFEIHYQPQLTLEGRIVGAEALLRWRHPERGMVSPSDFMSVAEESGLILPLGQWVLEAACKQLALWASQALLADLTLAVNVSALQFHQSDFVDQVTAALARSGAKADRLKLELTESLLVTNVDGIITKMNILRAHGVRFALDDFGTGYSSLTYLRRLPLDQLKIDQSFVRDIPDEPNACAIVRAIIVMGQSLGLAVIAEGVETEAQRTFLVDNGCRLYQGYLFGRPVPVGEFEVAVKQNHDGSE